MRKNLLVTSMAAFVFSFMLTQNTFAQTGKLNHSSVPVSSLKKAAKAVPGQQKKSGKAISQSKLNRLLDDPCPDPITASVEITISAGVNPDCAGDPITFTATPINGGATPVYQWKLNGNDVGTNSDTYINSTPANNDIITCEMTSSEACAVPLTVASNAITVTAAFTPAVVLLYSNPFGSLTYDTQLSVCASQTVGFLASASNTGISHHFQWKLNGNNVGINSSSYVQTGFSEGDVIICELTVDDPCATTATVVTQELTVHIYSVSSASLSIDGQNETCSGSNTYFSVNAVNAGFYPTFHWKKNGVEVGTNDYSYSDNTFITGDVITCTMTTDPECGDPATVESSNSITMIVDEPATPTVTISAANPVTSTGNIFTAVPAAGGADPIYQWQKNNLPIGVNSTTYSDVSLQPGDVITCTLVSSLSCVTTPTATSNSITVTSLTYCTPVPPNACTTAWIGGVVMGNTINRVSGCDGGYADYTATDTLVATNGETIDYIINEGGSTTGEFVNVYIDYNNDGDFTDQGELVVDGAYMDPFGFSATGSFVIPSLVAPGSYRIRVISDITDFIPTSCETMYGEAEDYILTITEPAYCIPVISQSCDNWISNVTIGNISNSSAQPENCVNGGYADYSGLLSTAAAPGQIINFSLAGMGLNNQRADIYVDYNGNGSFDDVDERVKANVFLSNAGIPATGSFTVPSSQPFGIYRIRVKSHNSSTIFTGPCGDDVTGETEDYRLLITCISNGSEIVVSGNGNTIEDGDGLPDPSDFTDFGDVEFNTTVTHEFTIANAGTGTLNISGVSFSGANASNFVIVSPPAATVAAGDNTSFTVQFTPTSSDIFSAVMHINNNVCSKADFDIALTGTGICPLDGPEINVQGNGLDILSFDFTPIPEDNTDFGTITSNTSLVKTFTIQNTGTENLVISDVQLSNFDNLLQFSIASMPASVIPPGESSDLSISFNAEGSGSRYVYVRILSGDCDESFYDFQLIGNSECGGGNAEINVQGNATDIADGDGSPDISDNTDLGTTLINSSVSQIFTIQNSGADPLSISGVSFTGIAAADFSVTTQPDAVVAPGGSTTFTVQFLPTTTGIKSAVVHVNNDDCDEGNYDFALQGKSIDYITLDLKLYLEGYYTGNSTMAATLFNLDLSQDQTATDSITVKLWSPGSLQNTNPDYTISAILHTDGTASVQFPAAVNGNSFYIAVAHRNSIETWSKDPLLMNINTAYDFSTAQNKAYDDGMNPPMVNLGDGKFAFYSGDANQDGTVDGADAIMVQDDIFQFSFGYNVTDVNGDGGTDGADAIIVQDNSFKSLYYARPY